MTERPYPWVFWWIRDLEGVAVGRIVQVEDNRYRAEVGVTTFKDADRTSPERFTSQQQAKEWAAARLPYRIDDLRIEPRGTGLSYSVLRDR